MTMNSWNTKLKRDRISNAISAQKLRDGGWTEGQLMDHFGVEGTTIKRWKNLVEQAVVEAEIYKERMKEERIGL